MSRMKCELLPMEGAFNVRDLGGYPGAGGRVLRKRRFIRAGSLSNLTEKGKADMLALGIDCIVDLRSTREVTVAPDTLPEGAGIDRFHIPMLDYIQSNIISGDYSTFPTSMPEMYRGLLDGGQDDLLRVFRVFADPRYNTVLFHCTAGKDRTGITAMLLLLLAGVGEEDVVEDYSWSERLIAPLEAAESDPNIPPYVFSSSPENMQEAVSHLAKCYGSARDYLSKAGLTPEEQARITAKLLGR